MKILSIITLLSCLIYLTKASSDGVDMDSNETQRGKIQVAGWNIDHVKDHITLNLIFFVILLVKLAYSYSEKLAMFFPESCMLVVIGIITGAILRYGLDIQSQADIWELTPNLFLLVLLPPIILEAAHHLCCRAFLDVFFPVIFFAVVGTVLNFLIIGVALYHTNLGGWMGAGTPKMNQTDCFLFASVMVAVDPVAVLAIFQEIHVDKLLYFYVFGESLFNDAVTIVLYYVVEAFLTIQSASPLEIFIGFLSFFTISFGGALIGIVFGVLSSLMTRLTVMSRNLEPVVILVMAYLSYLVGDMVKWSGIISIIACGMIQSSYAFHNMSHKSLITIRRFLKTLANFFESIIFIDLGIAILRRNFYLATGFLLWSLFITLIARFIVTFVSSYFLNKTGLLIKKISKTEQFIMSYGGLRGAVSFSLVNLIDADLMKKNNLEKDMFVTTALTIIIFTILFMGLTINPLVKLLKVKLEESVGLSIFTELSNNAADHFAAGMEAIGGRTGRNAFRERLEHFDIHYIRRVLQNEPESYDEKIIKVYEKVSLAIHYATVKHKCQSSHYLHKLSNPLRARLRNCHSQIALAHPEVHEEFAAEDRRGLPALPGVGTMIDMTENFLTSEEPETTRRRRRSSGMSSRGSVDFRTTVTSENYSSILRSGMMRPNAVAPKGLADEEDFLSQMHRNLNLRKEAYDLHEPCHQRHHHQAKHFTNLPRRRTNSFGDSCNNLAGLALPMKRVRTQSLISLSSESEIDPDLQPNHRRKSFNSDATGASSGGEDNPMFVLNLAEKDEVANESTDEKEHNEDDIVIIVSEH